MPAPPLRTLIRQIEKLSGGSYHGGDSRETTDRQLLDAFTTRSDEHAFAELVARHGPLVLRVCRRVLHHEQDAEDAFQATFLVLARYTGSIRKREALADWLHGVAYRTAMKAKRTAARRRNHEARLRERTPPPAASPSWDDVQAVLDEEIQRLPATFRSAFVLCVLEGKTVPAAAAELGCKEGTVSSRLTRARQRLQKLLARRGIKLGVLLAALCVAEGAARAVVPGVLADAVIRSGLLVAAGVPVAGLIPANVAALAAGVSRSMFLTKTKISTVVFLAFALLAAGAGVLTQQMLRADDKTPATPPAVKPAAEPAKPVEDTIEVTGRVLDPDGQPIAKARLFREHVLNDKHEVPADVELIALGATDAEGRFKVKMPRPVGEPKPRGGIIGPGGPGGLGGGAGGGGGGMMAFPGLGPAVRQPFAIIGTADGFGFNWIDLPRDEKPGEVTLRLVKDRAVHGRLVNTEGQPVAGVTATVVGVTGPVEDILDALMNRDGRTRDKPAVRALSAPLNRIVSVGTTDKDGRFEVTGLGTDRFALVEANSETAVLPLVLVATQEGFDPKKVKSVRGPGGAQQLFGPSFECVVIPARPVEGTVREAGSGRPVVGAEVYCRTARHPARALTDAKGHYTLIGLPKTDKYRIQVTPPKDAPLLTHTVEAEDRPGLERVTCDVEMIRGVFVKGRITDKATGSGVECAVNCRPLPDNTAATKIANLNDRLVGAHTDSEGRYSLVTLPGPNLLAVRVVGNSSRIIDDIAINPYKPADLSEADRKKLKMADKGRRGQQAVVVVGGTEILEGLNAVKLLEVKEEAGATADATVDAGKTLTLRLEDPDGKPLSGAHASGVAGASFAFLPLKDEKCPLFALDPERPRQVVFLHAERKLAAIVTVRGDGKDPTTVRLAPTAEATGRLLDGDGKPIIGANAYLLYTEAAAQIVVGRLGLTKPVRTDAEGRFHLTSVLPGAEFSLNFTTGREPLVEEKRKAIEPLKSGADVDLGDLRVKPMPRE